MLAKKDQRITSGIEDELGIFRKGSDYWKSLAEKGKSQNVLSSKDLSTLGEDDIDLLNRMLHTPTDR